MKTGLFFLLLIVATRTQAQLPADTVIHGIEVHFHYHYYLFPESWRVSPINGRGGSLESSEKSRTRNVLYTALNKYPRTVLEKNLVSVAVLKYMSFYDVGYGGTNSRDVVFLTNNGVRMGYTDKYIEQTFHHEFSSILYRNHPLLLDEAGWQASNPTGFDYRDPENGVGAIRNNESSQEIDTSLCSSGFLTQYALSGLENDINTVAQNLFLPAENFWWVVDRYPLIAKKTRILINFYRKIHPGFTEEFFRSQDLK